MKDAQARDIGQILHRDFLGEMVLDKCKDALQPRILQSTSSGQQILADPDVGMSVYQPCGEEQRRGFRQYPPCCRGALHLGQDGQANLIDDIVLRAAGVMD